MPPAGWRSRAASIRTSTARMPVPAAGPARRAHRSAVAGQQGRPARRHHDADRFRAVHARPFDPGRRSNRRRLELEGRVLLRLRLPSHADGRGAGRRISASSPMPCRTAMPASRSSPPTSGRETSVAWCRTATSGRRSRSWPRPGGVAAIHAEDNDIVMFMYEKLMRENRVGFEHMAEVHNALSEELSFNRVIRLAETRRGRRALHGPCLGGDRRGGAGSVAGDAASRCTAKRCTST